MNNTTTWVDGAAGSLFDLDNLPYGIFDLTANPGHRRVGVRIGDHVLDVAPLAAGLQLDVAAELDSPTLNPFMSLGKSSWDAARRWLVELLSNPEHREAVGPHLLPLSDVTMHMPFEVGDYVDFYASADHASNVGKIFRPDQAPLLPNWKHLPVGYHGRSGTVVPSGTDVLRPKGQRKPADATDPVFGPSTRLDIEAELGFVVGTGTELGDQVGTAAFAEHTFGVVGLNDWSARDIQAWEYVPLGPFLGKSFATSISHWVTPLEALSAAWCELPGQDGSEGNPQVLDYLKVDGPAGLDIDVEVVFNGHVVSRPIFRSMYWGAAQMLAHMTVNGASIRPGDLWGSGTISGAEPGQRGSFLELSWGWRNPFPVGDDERLALEDGDTVTLRYTAPGALGGRIALGEVSGRVIDER